MVLTYEVRQRMFRFLQKGHQLDLPNEVFVQFEWAPEPPFGFVAGGSRTVAQGSYGEAPQDVETGRYLWKSDVPFGAVDLTVEGPDVRLSFAGHRLMMNGRFENLDELASRIESIYYGMPLLLNLELTDSPLVTRVSGKVEDSPFDWIPKEYEATLDVTTKEHQEDRIRSALSRFPLLQDPQLLSALHYFWRACRLDRAGHTPFEFTAEVLLNLSKILEVLFPGKPQETIDAARKGLSELGYSDQEIGERFIPAIALRNHIDVAHASLKLFTADQLAVLHLYADAAESHFRELVERVCNAVAAGELELPKPQHEGPRSDVLKIIERLRKTQSEKPNPET